MYELTVTEETAKGSKTWTVQATDENLEATKAGLRSNAKAGDTITIQTRKI